MNGFGLTSAFNEYRSPKDFRLYAKVIRHKGELVPLNESEFGPFAGYDLVKTVKNERFGYNRSRRYNFENAKHLLVSEIKLMVDKLSNEKEKSGPELYEF